jgi:fused signal recognition particle receptor
VISTALLIVLGVVVVLGVAVLVRRRRVRQLQPIVSRAPMPDVLVSTTDDTLSLTAETLADRLSSSRGVFDRIRTVATRGSLAPEEIELVEEVLLRSDVGVALTTRVVDDLREHGAPDGVVATVRQRLLDIVTVGDREMSRRVESGRVPVWLFVGVNGVGKTTTIGKVAARECREGRTVVLAAGDTFRAAAADQLTLWAERSGADIVRGAEGSDPGAVIHDAIGRAAAKGCDLVIADTAGRRHTSSNLLDELSKIRRVADRGPGQVTETILVLDATTGQNAISQAREFLAAAQVTGLALTKLDGTARGGIVAALADEFSLPVKLVGVGESVDDLRPFDPDSFVDALLGE